MQMHICGREACPNNWFLWPTYVHKPNGISIGSSVFVMLTVVTKRKTHRYTDRHTDRWCWIDSKRLRHMLCTVMRAKNNWGPVSRQSHEEHLAKHSTDEGYKWCPCMTVTITTSFFWNELFAVVNTNVFNNFINKNRVQKAQTGKIIKVKSCECN